MGDMFKPVTDWISQNIPLTVLLGLFILSLFVEISKVKIYPLKWLWNGLAWPLKKIDERRTKSFSGLVEELKNDVNAQMTDLSTTITGQMTKMINSTDQNCQQMKKQFEELKTRFDIMDSKQDETEERLDCLAAARIKNHVLNFARQCRKGEPHSHEDFANLFKENEQYEKLVEKYKWKNDVYVEDYAYIKRVYREASDNRNFLA